MKNHAFLMKLLTAVLAVIGAVMLVSGLVLRSMESERRDSPDKEPMPEEYIEEFFADEKSVPQIEDYIEPEF